MQRLIIVMIVLFATGCVTVGREFDISSVDQLQPGVSTVEDAVALLGPYSTQAMNSKGMHSYGWSFAKSNGLSGRMESRAVMLVFGPDGKLEKKGSSQNNSRTGT